MRYYGALWDGVNPLMDVLIQDLFSRRIGRGILVCDRPLHDTAFSQRCTCGDIWRISHAPIAFVEQWQSRLESVEFTCLAVMLVGYSRSPESGTASCLSALVLSRTSHMLAMSWLARVRGARSLPNWVAGPSGLSMISTTRSCFAPDVGARHLHMHHLSISVRWTLCAEFWPSRRPCETMLVKTSRAQRGAGIGLPRPNMRSLHHEPPPSAASQQHDHRLSRHPFSSSRSGDASISKCS